MYNRIIKELEFQFFDDSIVHMERRDHNSNLISEWM
jgi:hypothetical protein